MTKCIDAYKLKESLERQMVNANTEYEKGVNHGISMSLMQIYSQEAIVVTPVIHAKWIKESGLEEFWCEHCGFSVHEKFNFCPYCGSKMENGEWK